jgi:DNA-binding NarL/FixJ family response regulator
MSASKRSVTINDEILVVYCKGLMTARILIADDNPHIRHALRHLIEQDPEWRVCGEAVDGKDAVRKARQLTPDLIVLDFLMPGMNGLEAAREINKAVPDVPILMCTMYVSRQLTEVAKRAGLQGTVPKTGIDQLAQGMRALLQHQTFFSTN